MNQPNFNLGMLMTPDTKKFWRNCLVLLLELTISTTTLTVAHFDPHCQAFTCQYVCLHFTANSKLELELRNCHFDKCQMSKSNSAASELHVTIF